MSRKGAMEYLKFVEIHEDNKGIGYECNSIEELINIIYDDFEKQFEKEQNANLKNEKAKSIIIDDLRRENTRLKKQLANNHHIECMCSFCKPIGEVNANQKTTTIQK